MEGTIAIHKILMIIVPIFMLLVFIVVFAMVLSPKLRGKMMARNIKSMKYMLDESKDSLEEMGNTAINIRKKIIDENEDVLKETASKEGDIASIGVEKKARAIRKGLLEDEIYCKYCGKSIEKDSKFCKYCGKEL